MPFKSTAECKEPAAQETVWRYLDLPKFINLLQTKSIYFHRSDKFSDPFEGSTPKALVDLRREGYNSNDDLNEEYLNTHSKFIEEVRKFTFVSCWHLNEHESAAMWDLYGRSDKGIAIKTTVEGLKSAIADVSYPINMSELYYVDFHSEWADLDEQSKGEIRRFLSDKDGPNTIDSILFKRQSFTHERELRLFFQNIPIIPEDKVDNVKYNMRINGSPAWKPLFIRHPLGRSGAVYLMMEPAVSGIHLDINTRNLIDEVKVAPGADNWFLDTVKKAAINSNWDLDSKDVTRSDADNDVFY